MHIYCSQIKSGININLAGKNFKLDYPNNIWDSFPSKDFLFDNLAHLLTISMPLVSNIKKIEYNTAKPLFRKEFSKSITDEITSSADDLRISAKKIIKKFKDVQLKFENSKIKIPPRYSVDLNERAVVPFSCGKETLLTAAVSHELGLNPILTYINDTVSPTENRIKIRYTKNIAKKFNLKSYIIRNEIENLNDFEFWNKPETTLGYAHMITSFALISLPILHKHRAKYLFLGNEQNLNFLYRTNDGIKTSPSPDQTSSGTIRMNSMIRKIMPKAHLGSLIEPLTNLATMKILHTRYKQFGKYQMSCDCLDASNEMRWCQENSMCADMFLFLKANNIDPKTVQFTKNMFSKKLLKCYTLFNGREADKYDKAPESRDQQLLSFYMAYRNKAKGYAIEKFKKKFLKEATAREDELYKKFLKVYPAMTLPPKLRKEATSIYKEELNE